MEKQNYTIKSISKYITDSLCKLYPVYEAKSITEYLLGYVFKMNNLDMHKNAYKIISTDQYENICELLNQLLQSKPVQYITGEAYFYGLKLKVNSDVLIPRKETEELVNWIINDNKENNNISILDIGTGSGCIAVTVAKYIPCSQVFAMDVSEKAIEIAKINSKQNNVNINFIKADILKEDMIFDSTFDIIVSNPPYVTLSEKKYMMPNVLNYEPYCALFVPDNEPLIFYRKIISLSQKILNKNGMIYFEINERFGQDIIELLKDNSFINITLRKDFQGKDRMIKAQKNG
jgi:release factor glutamine methyltransferase